MRRSNDFPSPEARLQFTLLVDALAILRKNLPVPETAAKRRLTHETWDWVFSNREVGHHSFLGVCAAFGLDPAVLRQRVLAWCLREPAVPRGPAPLASETENESGKNPAPTPSR